MDLKAILGEKYKEDMTMAEVEAALVEVDMVDRATINKDFVPKATADKYASEAARYRKANNEAATDKTALEDRIKELEKQNAIGKNKAKFVSQGMEDAQAQEAAEALADGDMDKVFTLQEAMMKKLKEQAVSDKLHDMTPPPGGGSDTGAVDFDKELQKAYEDNNMALVASLTRQKYEAAKKEQH